jgi:hypothetical protein
MYKAAFTTQCLRFVTWGILAGGLVTAAWADPVIAWVIPPVWIQTPTESAPARPGTPLTGMVWLTTGKGAKVGVRIGQELVELDQNSLWEWQGLNDGTVGNTLQGAVRVASAPDLETPQTLPAAGEARMRLQQGAPWMLILDAGENPDNAKTLVTFLRNSGYPVSSIKKRKHTASVHWQFSLDGIASREAASSMGVQLLALAPGILSATPQRKAVETEPVVKAKNKSSRAKRDR